MNNFYARLLEELENTENDIWVETVLTGEHAGEKRISRSEEKCWAFLLPCWKTGRSLQITPEPQERMK